MQDYRNTTEATVRSHEQTVADQSPEQTDAPQPLDFDLLEHVSGAGQTPLPRNRW